MVRLLAGLMVGVLLWGGALSAVGQQAKNAPSQQKVSELERKTQSIKARAAEMRRKKYEKMREAAKVNRSMVVNQQKLESERRSLRYQEHRLQETRDKLVYYDRQLDRTMGEAVRLGQDAGQRLRSMYMGERLSMMQMIMEANDLSTLLDRLYYKQKIVAQDKQLLVDLNNKVVELNRLKVDLANQRALIAQTISRKQAAQQEIRRAIELDRALRDRYRNDAVFYDRAESELLAESNNVTSQIRALTRGGSAPAKVSSSTGVFMWPLQARISSPFGMRYHPIHKKSRMHTGLDIAGPNGAPIKAADGGVVIHAGWRGGYGKAVIINHGTRNGKNIATLYAHLSSISVSKGQTVSKGQVIGREGTTGYSTGPHLHFEVRLDGTPVNPMGYLR